MDMKLPRINGYEATRLIKKIPDLADKPIVAVTASAMKPDEDRMRRAGCDSLLIKPISKQDLVSELARFLPHNLERNTPDQDALSADPTAGSLAAWCMDSLSENSRAALPEFLEILDTEITDKWDHIQKTFIFKEIEYFADELDQLAGRFELMPVQSWAEALKQQSRNFDMERLPKTLAFFPQMRQTIRKLAMGISIS